MAVSDGQQFLKDLDRKLWTAADELRSNLDAAVYKHAVLGLVFLKYMSDAFDIRQQQVESKLCDEADDYFLDPSDYEGDEYEHTIRQELEVRDHYVEENVFWVPALARWKTIQESASLAAGTEIEFVNGKKITYKITSIGKLIDDALAEVEKENPKLKGVLDKNYTPLQLPFESLIGLINLLAEIPFQHRDLDAKDILGHVCEYFLGQFALAEGKKGGQYYMPKSIVNLIVEMFEPFKGRVYDPAMNMLLVEEDRNAETRRTQSCYPRLSSASPRFKSSRDEIAEHGCVFTPGRYVGAEEVEDDGVPIAEKMTTLTTELAAQFAESAKLQEAIRKNMKALGFELPVGGKK